MDHYFAPRCLDDMIYVKNSSIVACTIHTSENNNMHNVSTYRSSSSTYTQRERERERKRERETERETERERERERDGAQGRRI